MYVKGISTKQFSETIEDIYGFDVSEGIVSDITDKLLPEIENRKNLANSKATKNGQCLYELGKSQWSTINYVSRPFRIKYRS